MTYFTIASTDIGILVDSISKDFYKLRTKFPEETIYMTDELSTIFVDLDHLIEFKLL